MIRNRSTLETSDLHRIALECIDAGIGRALPERLVGESVRVDGSRLHIAETSYDLDAYADVVVVGGGNAAGRLAAALEDVLGDRVTNGVVVTDEPAPSERIRMVEGSHPVPDEAAVRGVRSLLDVVEEADDETLLLAVITGGGSALLPAPAGDVTLADLQTTTDALLRSGATIDEINAVRKHLSLLKGGQLARAAAPATTVSLLISDVVGNRLDVIASGPTVPDGSTFADARDVVEEYALDVPASVRARIEAGVNGDLPETPKPGDEAFDRVTVHLLADGMTAPLAAAEAAEARGFEPLVLSSRVRGEAREAAKTHVAVAEEILASGHPIDPPAVVVSGGETTVTVRGDGEGGPNQEFALSGAIELSDPGICLCSVDTDGIDGATDAAGAIVDCETATPKSAARAALRDNDAYPFLEDRNALVVTGATGTNVNDLRVLVVDD